MPTASCTLCNPPREFKSDFALTVHNRRVHEHPERWAKAAKKRATTMRNRILAEQGLTPEVVLEPFECPRCPNNYKNGAVLATHIRNVHKLGTTGMGLLTATAYKRGSSALQIPIKRKAGRPPKTNGVVQAPSSSGVTLKEAILVMKEECMIMGEKHKLLEEMIQKLEQLENYHG